MYSNLYIPSSVPMDASKRQTPKGFTALISPSMRTLSLPTGGTEILIK